MALIRPSVHLYYKYYQTVQIFKNTGKVLISSTIIWQWSCTLRQHYANH